jgi:hypothetical protein
MSTSQSPSAAHPLEPQSRWTTGFALFAGDEIYVTAPDDVYAFDLTSWGWIHFVLGVLVAVAGGAVLSGRVVGIIAGARRR